MPITKIALSRNEFGGSVGRRPTTGFQVRSHPTFRLGTQTKINKFQLFIIIQ